MPGEEGGEGGLEGQLGASKSSRGLQGNSSHDTVRTQATWVDGFLVSPLNVCVPLASSAPRRVGSCESSQGLTPPHLLSLSASADAALSPAASQLIILADKPQA